MTFFIPNELTHSTQEHLISTKAQRITGWVLTGLVGLFMIGASGFPKFIDWPGKAEMMSKLEIPLPLLPTIGVIEIVVTLIYLIPRTSLIAAILMTGYLGGAVFTHLRVGDPWFFPLIIGLLAWLGLALRQPVLFRLVTAGSPKSADSTIPSA
jgi:hypothetical protein